jgi:prepilin-type N-terminal cleavage/methylation domain-containing protein
MREQSRGFTLVEVIVAAAILIILFFVTTQSLFRGSRVTSLSEVTNQLVRDLRETQIRAMQGQTSSGGGLLDRSIRFDSNQYIVFPGSVYDPDNPDNYAVILPETIQVSDVSFADDAIIFARGSGDVRNYVSGADTLVITDSGLGASATVRVNNRGVVFVTKQ